MKELFAKDILKGTKDDKVYLQVMSRERVCDLRLIANDGNAIRVSSVFLAKVYPKVKDWVDDDQDVSDVECNCSLDVLKIVILAAFKMEFSVEESAIFS